MSPYSTSTFQSEPTTTTSSYTSNGRPSSISQAEHEAAMCFLEDLSSRAQSAGLSREAMLAALQGPEVFCSWLHQTTDNRRQYSRRDVSRTSTSSPSQSSPYSRSTDYSVSNSTASTAARSPRRSVRFVESASGSRPLSGSIDLYSEKAQREYEESLCSVRHKGLRETLMEQERLAASSSVQSTTKTSQSSVASSAKSGRSLLSTAALTTAGVGILGAAAYGAYAAYDPETASHAISFVKDNCADSTIGSTLYGAGSTACANASSAVSSVYGGVTSALSCVSNTDTVPSIQSHLSSAATNHPHLYRFGQIQATRKGVQYACSTAASLYGRERGTTSVAPSLSQTSVKTASPTVKAKASETPSTNTGYSTWTKASVGVGLLGAAAAGAYLYQNPSSITDFASGAKETFSSVASAAPSWSSIYSRAASRATALGGLVGLGAGSRASEVSVPESVQTAASTIAEVVLPRAHPRDFLRRK